MKKHGIRAKTKKKFKATTNSKHNLPIVEYLLDREMLATISGRNWKHFGASKAGAEEAIAGTTLWPKSCLEPARQNHCPLRRGNINFH